MDIVNNKENLILLFDGVCNLCNSAVQFVIKRDKKKKFLYTSLQSKTGQKLLLKYGLNLSDFDSFILIENEKYFTKSTAALKVAKGLGGIWSMLYIFIIIPKFSRNAIYDFIAQNRYKWFGKRDECMLPSPEFKDLFLQ